MLDSMESFINSTLGEFLSTFDMVKVWKATPVLEVRCCPDDFQKIVEGLISMRNRSELMHPDPHGGRTFRFLYNGIPIIFKERRAEVL